MCELERAGRKKRNICVKKRRVGASGGLGREGEEGVCRWLNFLPTVTRGLKDTRKGKRGLILGRVCEQGRK